MSEVYLMAEEGETSFRKKRGAQRCYLPFKALTETIIAYLNYFDWEGEVKVICVRKGSLLLLSQRREGVSFPGSFLSGFPLRPRVRRGNNEVFFKEIEEKKEPRG